MLLKFVKTFWLMTGISTVMFILLLVIYWIIRFILYGVDDIHAEDLPNGLEKSFDMALKIILIFFNIFGILAVCTTATWAVRAAFFKIWS